MEENMAECQICFEKFTSTRRKKVPCKNHECDEECCLACFERHLLESENIDPKCMFCSENIPFSHIRDYCSNEFCNKKFHLKRTNTEYERQMSLLPTSQHLAALEVEREKYRKEIAIYDDEIRKLRDRIWEIEREKNRVPYPTTEGVKNSEDNKITFTQKCPSEDCNGFLSSSWKCGICDKYYCSKCHESLRIRNDPEHECDEDTVKTIQAIKKDSKPCPKCATYIFKINGCDQMWCPNCKTAFSWKTGKIETGTIHNPHYFQFLRDVGNGNIPRQPGDVAPCEMIPGYYEITRQFNSYNLIINNDNEITRRRNYYNQTMKFYRMRGHVSDVILRKYPTDYQDQYTQMRVDFLMKRTTEEAMKDQIKKLIKKEEKNREVSQIYNMYNTVTGEMLKNISQILREKKPSEDLFNELKKEKPLVDYCNQNLQELKKKFKNSVTFIEYAVEF